MKQGRTLQELAAELERQSDAKRDLVVPTSKMEMRTEIEDHEAAELRQTTVLAVDHNGGETFPVRPHAHGQIASQMKIPKRYYDRMLEEAPELLADNVNTWMARQTGTSRMVRTLDGNARAYLSDRYRPLDNNELAEAVLPTLISTPGLAVQSCEVTERRMYIKAVTERVSFEVKRGDVVQAGIVISNSEIGAGSVRIEPMLFRLVCLNGMISPSALRKYHVGGRHGDGDDVAELLTDATKQQTDAAFWMQVRDVVKGSLSQVGFEKIVAKVQAAANEPITGHLDKVVEVAAQKLTLTDGESAGVLRHLATGGDLSRWGMVNALTRYSQDVDDYDRATEFERMGGNVIELPRNDWQVIAEAAA